MARRVLLADDSVTAQNMGRRILADAGYDVISVNNGSAALKKVAEQKPDLIVLDVYMPGYGGLEVCQRLKENYETASIPILLSVGKLEPFKAEDAKKVRADAFIVKPFEASELLTAIAKLEDKIKPQAAAQKHGRFGKTLDQAGERFGDKETGWKYRLIIPALTESALQQDSALEKPKGEVVPQSDLKAAEPRRESETAIPAGLPTDITPEEIAALAAAAAAFSGHEQKPTGDRAAHTEAPPQAAIAHPEPAADLAPVETAAATLAAVAAAQPSTEPIAQVSPAPPETEAAVEAHQAPEAPVPIEIVTATPETNAAAAHVDERPADTPDAGKWGKDAEVLAALASLLPAADASPADGASRVEPNAGEIPTSIAAVGGATTAGPAECIGSRWMAEPVPLMEEETTLLLEQEMEKAFAAFAAAEAARMNAAVEVPGANAVIPSEIAAPVPLPESAAPVELPATAAIANGTEAAAAAEIKEVAYAAAASVASVADAITPAEMNSATVTPPVGISAAPAATEEIGRQTEVELAAAWQNWKQIRESIIGSEVIGAELTSQIAGVAAAELKSGESEVEAPDEAVAESMEAESEANDASGSAAIASIVDSVLAELKPKLVEEIAKKMKQQEKKGKQKKGKK